VNPAANTATATAAAPRPDWLGHPRGLAVLFFTEMWERTSYYGMRSLLVLYMVNHLFLRPDLGAEVLGFNALRHALEAGFGTLTPQALASQVYGLYTGFVYLTPLFGGLLADRLLGRRRTVVVGSVLMTIGHFLMASERLFLPALMFLIVGNGCFKPNLSTQVGMLYPPGDTRRDRAYSLYYMGVNLGAFIAPLICGTLGQTLGWHYGFGAAGVGMVLGLVIYLLNQDKLPHEALPTPSTRAPLLGTAAYVLGLPVGIVLMLWLLALPTVVMGAVGAAVIAVSLRGLVQLPADERPRVMATCAACMVTAAFWAIYEQQGNTLQLWADERTTWPTLFGWTLPSTWYQAFNPLMIWIFVPLLNGLWAWQARRGTEPSSLAKMGIGCTLTGLGFVVMIIGAADLDAGQRQHLGWLTVATAIFTIGELFLSPVGLSFVSQVAPARMVSMLMGVWFLSSFFGNYLSGYLGSFYETMSNRAFFAMLTAIGVGAGLLLFAMSRPLDRIVGAHGRRAGTDV